MAQRCARKRKAPSLGATSQEALQVAKDHPVTNLGRTSHRKVYGEKSHSWGLAYSCVDLRRQKPTKEPITVETLEMTIYAGNLGRDCPSMPPRLRADQFLQSSIASKCAMAWTTISDGAPESGGGGASAAISIESSAPSASCSDDDGGDPDPEPARLRRQTDGIAPGSGDALLRLRGVQARVPLSKSAIYQKMREGTFPQPIRLGARCSLWKSSDIDAWLNCLSI